MGEETLYFSHLKSVKRKKLGLQRSVSTHFVGFKVTAQITFLLGTVQKQTSGNCFFFFILSSSGYSQIVKQSVAALHREEESQLE